MGYLASWAWLGYKLGLRGVLAVLIGLAVVSGWLDRVVAGPLNNPPFPPLVPQGGKGSCGANVNERNEKPWGMD